MGSWLSRKKKSVADQLEAIAAELNEMELFRRETEFSRKRLVGYIILLSIIFYVVVVLFGYFYYFPHSWSEALLRLLLFLLLPLVLFWATRFLINWLFALKQERNDQRAAHLCLRRTQLLEEVKAKEPYKVAKEILEKFDPQMKMEAKMAEDRKRQQQTVVRRPVIKAVPPSPQGTLSGNNNVGETPNFLRQRPQPSLGPAIDRTTLEAKTGAFGPSASSTPASMRTTTEESGQLHRPMFTPSNTIQLNSVTKPPGPILPRDRTVVDKVVDYLLGDGPSNRYALICRQCHSHNGMSLREEFEFVAFRCCYCYAFNPARKQMPNNPGLSISEAGSLPNLTVPSTRQELYKQGDDSDLSSVGESSHSGRESPGVGQESNEPLPLDALTGEGGTSSSKSSKLVNGHDLTLKESQVESLETLPDC